MRIVAIGLGCLLGIFFSITWWALEVSDVAVIETKQAEGHIRTTHVWWVKPAGQFWLEAGSPSNGWFVDIGENPLATIRWNGEEAEYVALPIRNDHHHQWIRSAIRHKYGFRDWWVDLFVDTSRSIAVILVPQESRGPDE